MSETDKRTKAKLTYRCFFLFGFPHGSRPPEKLGKLRQTIDLMLYIGDNNFSDGNIKNIINQQNDKWKHKKGCQKGKLF